MFRFVLTAAAGISVFAVGCLTLNRLDTADENIRDWLVARHVVDASYHGCQSRLWESAQGDKWSFCLTAGKIGPRIRREHEQKTAPEPCIGL